MTSTGDPVSKFKRESSGSGQGQPEAAVPEQSSGVEVAHRPLLFPVFNQLAKITFGLGLGTSIGIFVAFATDGMWIGYVSEGIVVLCIGLCSSLGIFCGHCACRQIRLRQPKQKGLTLALIGLVLSYICLSFPFYAMWAYSQGTI